MYPKDFFANNPLEIEPGLCFVMMPFDARFTVQWATVQEVVTGEPFNLHCRRADDISAPGNIIADVLEQIGRAQVLIADLTGRNANVFYELGVAHSVKDAERVILLASDMDDVPFDLRQLRSLVYRGDMDRLRAQLTNALTEIGVRQYELELGQGETEKFGGRLTGADRCLYDVEVSPEYIGDDGVKFTWRLIRYVAGREPQVGDRDGGFIGRDYPAVRLDRVGWSILYGGPAENDPARVRLVLARDTGDGG